MYATYIMFKWSICHLPRLREKWKSIYGVYAASWPPPSSSAPILEIRNQGDGSHVLVKSVLDLGEATTVSLDRWIPVWTRGVGW